MTCNRDCDALQALAKAIDKLADAITQHTDLAKKNQDAPTQEL